MADLDICRHRQLPIVKSASIYTAMFTSIINNTDIHATIIAQAREAKVINQHGIIGRAAEQT